MELNWNFNDKHIFVCGDLILDEWVEGRCTRLSPEAPVPVIKAGDNKRYAAGGAANVATNLRALGWNVTMFGFVGPDEPSQIVRELLVNEGIEIDGLTELSNYTTPLKTRYIADGQQIIRVDKEQIHKVSEREYEFLTERITTLGERRGAKALILSDYAKGTFNNFPVHLLTTAQLPFETIGIGPKPDNLSVFACNWPGRIDSYKQFYSMNELEWSQCNKKNRFNNLWVTRGEYGADYYLHSDSDSVFNCPTQAVEVFDVVGAGDTFLATAITALCHNWQVYDATTVANTAAAIAIKHHGVYSVSYKELDEAVRLI